MQGHLHLEVHAHFEKVSTDTVFPLTYIVRIRPEPVEPFSWSGDLFKPNTVTLSFESGASVEQAPLALLCANVFATTEASFYLDLPYR